MTRQQRMFSKEEWSWIFYDWANSAYAIFIATVLPIFALSMANSAGVDSTTHTANWGFTSAIACALVALASPILGTIADYKGVRKRFFIAFFALGVLSTGIIPIVNEYMAVLVIYALTNFGFAGANVFYDAFLLDVTTPARMDKVSTWGFGMGYIGGSTIPFLVTIALNIWGESIGVDGAMTVRIACFLTAAWWAVFTLPLLVNVRQISGIEREPRMVANSFRRLGEVFRNIKQYKHLVLFLVAYFFYIDGVGTIIKMATTYGGALGIGSTELMLGLLITQVVAFPCAILYGKLAGRFSAKTMILAGICTYFAVCIVGFFMRSATEFYILAGLVGTAQGGIQALSRSYFGKAIPDKRRAGEFFGFFSVFSKFESVLGTFLMGIVITVTQNINMGVLPVLIMFIVGGIIMLRVPSDKALD
ncbi:MAG: MFS transporter, partial [Clostridia bacterium]|nr:MFS transporter [Clostridia bacterium]